MTSTLVPWRENLAEEILPDHKRVKFCSLPVHEGGCFRAELTSVV